MASSRTRLIPTALAGFPGRLLRGGRLALVAALVVAATARPSAQGNSGRTGVGQIPYGSTITSASLRVQQTSTGSSSAAMSLYRALADWDASSTWHSLTTSGVGVQFDNVEVASTADGIVSNLSKANGKTFSGAGVTAAVQSWANGQTNRGWFIFQNNSSTINLGTPDRATTSYRPLLTVTYKAPVETTSMTGTGVTVRGHRLRSAAGRRGNLAHQDHARLHRRRQQSSSDKPRGRLRARNPCGRPDWR